MIINKDLRDLNKDEFKDVYEYIKQRTNNFTCLNKEILDKNPQYLLVVRFALGLSQLEFSKLLGTTNKQWVRHFEAGRQGFKNSEMYEKALELINRLFSENKIVDYERTLLSWNKCRVARRKYFINYPEPKYQMKRFFEMHKEDFIQYFNYLKKETKNFTDFDYDIIIRDPIFLTIFRIVLCLNVRELGKLLDFKDSRRLRKYESYNERMLPETADKIMKILEKQIKIKGVNLENAIKRFEKSSPFTNLELEIKDNLEKNGILVDKDSKNNSNRLDGKMQVNVKSIKKEMNIDFVIPNEETPLIVIEVTRLSNYRNRFDITFRIAYIDHRFQLLKLKHPNIKTFMIIKADNEISELAKRTIERETVNTDFYFVNDFENLGKEIKGIL